jgi:hypothetical protein
MQRLIALLLWLPSLLSAQDIEVDVELFLAVDISRSVSNDELDIQRRGYAEALTSDDVLKAVRNGLLGRVAVTYVEWAGAFAQRVIVPWTVLETRADAERIAQAILTHDETGLRRTSISGAIRFAAASFDANGFVGLRRVIDVSGDGPNNHGRPVEEARDAALAQGFIINGLPLMTQDLLSEIWGIPDLDLYYLNCVTGGPGAFVIPVRGWSEFPQAVKRKLVLEIAARPERIIPAQSTIPEPYDCLIGERMWRENRTFFDIP